MIPLEHYITLSEEKKPIDLLQQIKSRSKFYDDMRWAEDKQTKPEDVAELGWRIWEIIYTDFIGHVVPMEPITEVGEPDRVLDGRNY